MNAAGLLQSPESAVELTRRRSEDLALRVELAPMGGPRAVPFELGESLLPAVRWLVARVAELEAERHETNEALSDAAEALRANRDRIAALEAVKLARFQECPVCGAGYEHGQPCTQCEFRKHMAAAEVLAEASTPWVGDLPAGPVLCRCGHTGADHHHAGRSCGAMLPRRHEPGGPWGPLEPCTCREFAAGPSRGELAEQRHLLDPLDHRLERLAPGSGVTA
ncbi:hypothetical protein K701_25360 [Streptomyces fradiae ATCC 10745 = DSM 40063]|uniref:Uncharacterized protein n=1 Tax=Streptomyces fradiae ATCC 10745 = DSM 40063 TaxID=1319510 RepID=A0ABQ6XP92_STRFR|nr:hypothetical protein K701_25360 [Streptomyces fradiae ATCC 10745 = DSM 40063]QEV12059.1 hypothetical protein CP974_08530 [Streptomyces fradiae ATCC 10745 = DSM 40063]